jgi:hypothetical protein
MSIKLPSDKTEVAIGFGLVLIAALIMCYVPPDMDDYNQYHALACWHYPYSSLNVFAIPCAGKMNLKLWGGIIWPRSYWYVGAAYSLLYYPLFMLWPQWQSTVLLGIVIMIPGVLSASRLLKVSLPVTLLVLCGTFPVMYYVLRDYGQITLQFSLLYLIPWALYKAATGLRVRAWLPFSMLAGFLLAMGVESKPLFCYFVPSIAIVTLAFCRPIKPGLSLFLFLLRRFAPGMALCVFLLTLLFTGVDGNGVAYYRQLAGLVPMPGVPAALITDTASGIPNYYINKEVLAPSVWEQSHGVLQGLLRAKHLLGAFWFDFPNAARFSYGMNVPLNLPFDWRGILQTMPFWLIFGFVTVVYLTKCRIKEPPQTLLCVVALLVASAVGVVAVSMNIYAIKAHHVLQPFYYLLGAFAIMLEAIYRHLRKHFVFIVAMLLTSQIGCAYYVTSLEPLPRYNWERIEMLDFITSHQLAEKSVIDNLDWGVYYLASLYGPKDQLVLMDASYNRTIQLAHKLKRYALFIRQASDAPPLNMGGLRLVFPQTKRSHTWEVWTDAPL